MNDAKASRVCASPEDAWAHARQGRYKGDLVPVAGHDAPGKAKQGRAEKQTEERGGRLSVTSYGKRTAFTVARKSRGRHENQELHGC